MNVIYPDFTRSAHREADAWRKESTDVVGRREKADADYLTNRITELLTPWQVSERRIRAAIREALNVRRDVPGLTNDQIVRRVLKNHKPTDGGTPPRVA